MLPSGYVFRNSHATILEWLNEASRIAQRPRHEQEAEWARLSSGIAARKSNYFEVLPNLFAFLLMPAVEQAAKAGNRHYAQIGCARLMIALERHRLKAKSWPDAAKLESALAPSLLPSWPRDAFVDAPLKLEKTADGWRIWSVGPEKKPDGMSPQKNQRIIYRLLDPEKRRRPQPAKAADKPQEAQ